jgi:hypothetical protein
MTQDPDRNLSYWQRGCNDAKAGKPFVAPFTLEQRRYPPTGWTAYGIALANEGYRNGYDWGSQRPTLPPEAHMPVIYREVRLGAGHTPTACGPIKREPLRPPVAVSLMRSAGYQA